MCGCTYRLAIFEPNSRLRASLGTAKFTSPVSTTGLMTITSPPPRRTCISVRISRGWLLGGFPPMTNTKSAPSTSASETVAVPVPTALVSPTPLAWWQ